MWLGPRKFIGAGRKKDRHTWRKAEVQWVVCALLEQHHWCNSQNHLCMFSMYRTSQSWQVSVIELFKTVKSGRKELQLLVFAYTANILTVSLGKSFPSVWVWLRRKLCQYSVCLSLQHGWLMSNNTHALWTSLAPCFTHSLQWTFKGKHAIEWKTVITKYIVFSFHGQYKASKNSKHVT